MKALVLLAAVVIISAWLADTPQCSTNRVSEGEVLYTPSRLEWLLINVKVSSPGAFPELPNGRLGINVSIDPENANTLLLTAMHSKNITAVQIDSLFSIHKMSIDSIAKEKGWNSWLKIREKRVYEPSLDFGK